MMVYLFVGTSGVIVHEHYCKKEGASYSLFLPVQHDCQLDRVEVTCHEKACCVTVTQSSDLPSFQNESCCDEFVNYVHVDQDWNSHDTALELDVDGANHFGTLMLGQVPTAVEHPLAVVRPPPIPQNIRLALLQSYLI